MPSSSTRPVRLPGLCIALGLASTTLAGCYSPYGYQGQYGGPGYYGQPAYQAPGYQGPVYPGSPGPPLGNGGTYIPGGTSPGTSPTPINSPNTYENPNGPIRFESPNNNAPDFNPSPGTGRGNVPDPLDDLNRSSPPGASKPTLTPTSGTTDNEFTTPFEQPGDANGGATSPPAQPSATQEADPFFEAPLQLKSSATSGAKRIQTVSYEQPQTTQLNPYGRDTKHANPTWLRGVVDYDQKQRSWSILYSANPDPRDSNGGVLTLANHPNLAKCRLGEVVLAEGAIDARQTDARGKPIYVLDNVTPLQAK